MRASAAMLLGFSAVLSVVALAAEPTGVWLDVPFIKQQGNGCGAASITMVARYWSARGGPATPDAASIDRALYSKDAKGVFESDMVRYFKTAGFSTFAFAGEWKDLREHLSKGRPLIVCLGEGTHGAPYHFVVVTGLDWKQNVVMVNDPARRKLLKMERDTFEKRWELAERWTLLALPREAR